MKQYTEKEIVQAVEQIYEKERTTNKDAWIECPSEIDVTIYENRVEIKVSKMYDHPSLNLGILMGLAEFFGTKNINDDDRYSWSGCDTCDYGSSYGFTLTVRPEK